MFLIADNISTRRASVRYIFQQAKAADWDTGSEPAQMLSELTRQCVAAGANALEINIQQHYDRPEAMQFAVNVVQGVTDLQLCLSTNNAEALQAGLRASKHLSLVNYLSIDEAKLREMLPVAANHGAGVVFLVGDIAVATDVREMLQKTAILVGAANEVGIPNDSIFVDPGLIHITSVAGQRHLVEILDFLRALPDATDPAVKSTCWLVNGSAGAPQRLRPVIETALLLMLAGAGLSSVFLDVLLKENRRTVRLLKIFNNELVYSDGEIRYD
ncbi:MAG: dihydropteroate synthase [Chloroflexi bacterium]|nr:dihydropteroate synthase [Chloroflexota bacterium]